MMPGSENNVLHCSIFSTRVMIGIDDVVKDLDNLAVWQQLYTRPMRSLRNITRMTSVALMDLAILDGLGPDSR